MQEAQCRERVTTNEKPGGRPRRMDHDFVLRGVLRGALLGCCNFNIPEDGPEDRDTRRTRCEALRHCNCHPPSSGPSSGKWRPLSTFPFRLSCRISKSVSRPELVLRDPVDGESPSSGVPEDGPEDDSLCRYLLVSFNPLVSFNELFMSVS